MRKTSIVFVLSAATLAAVVALDDPTRSLGPTQAQRATTPAEVRVRRIAEAQRDVQARLRDPSSAVFGQAFVAEGNLVCGLVNARNGLGGMTGMSPYIAGYANGMVVFYQSNPVEFEPIWAKTCGGTPSKTAKR